MLTGMINGSVSGNLSYILIGIAYIPLCLVYIAGRLTLIVISFSSLRAPPDAAYKTVYWSTSVSRI